MQLREAAVDHPAFSRSIAPCQLAKCRATCCHDGVWLSEPEARTLAALAGEHADLFRSWGVALPGEPIIPAGREWKTATRDAAPEELAEDYPAHFPRTRCVFLDPQHRCAWQRLAMEQGRDPWFWKPLTCWIHPLQVRSENTGGRPVLTLPSPETDRQRRPGYPGFSSCTHCGRPDSAGQPAGEVLAPELTRLGALCGRDFAGEISAQDAPW